MYTTTSRNRIFIVFLLLGLLSVTVPVYAQNAVRQAVPLVSKFKSFPMAEPVFENPPRQIVFKITTVGDLTGDLVCLKKDEKTGRTVSSSLRVGEVVSALSS